MPQSRSSCLNFPPGPGALCVVLELSMPPLLHKVGKLTYRCKALRQNLLWAAQHFALNSPELMPLLPCLAQTEKQFWYTDLMPLSTHPTFCCVCQFEKYCPKWKRQKGCSNTCMWPTSPEVHTFTLERMTLLKCPSLLCCGCYPRASGCCYPTASAWCLLNSAEGWSSCLCTDCVLGHFTAVKFPWDWVDSSNFH